MLEMQFHTNFSPDSLPTLCSEDDPQDVYDQRSNDIEIPSITPVPIPNLIASLDCIQYAIDNEMYPTLASDCTGGTYFCYNQFCGIEAVFKPFDEEPYCINNPKNLTPQKFSEDVYRGIQPGTAGFREVAAYYLDHEHSAGVPETTLVNFPSFYNCFSTTSLQGKSGSLQLFVPHECSSEDYGPVKFSVANIQRIAILDIRLLNLDRHENNLLVIHNSKNRPTNRFAEDSLFSTSSRAACSSRRSQSVCTMTSSDEFTLIPIDHGYSLPVMTTQAIPEWCWLRWFQSKLPLLPEVCEYVRCIDIERDIYILRTYLNTIEEDAINTLRINTMWLKLSVMAGLTLNQIAQFYYPLPNGEKSGFQFISSLYYESYFSQGVSFPDFLIDIGSDYMLQQIQKCLLVSSL